MADLDKTDFSMKPQVDPAAIAGIIQRKRIAEIEAKQAQRSQRMQELSQTIGLATNLASTMVEQSKSRQKRDFVNALSESMAATVPMQTTSFGTPKQLSSLLPAMSSVASPDIAKQELMRSATQVSPEKAADFAFKMANPSLSDNSISFQRMTLKGSDGKNKTVNVGVLGTQIVNPFTKQPINPNNPKEIDNLPEYGFVEREEYAGTDSEGQPVFRNPVSQEVYTKDAKGGKTAFSGPILPKLQNPSEAMTNKVQFIDETRSNLKDAISKFDANYVGLIDKQFKNIGAYIENATDPKAEEFRNLIEEINITRRHEMFGSALTESERKSFKDISLDRNVSASAFMARLRTLERKLGNKEKALIKSAKATGKAMREVPETSSFDLGDGFSYSIGEE